MAHTELNYSDSLYKKLLLIQKESKVARLLLKNPGYRDLDKVGHLTNWAQILILDGIHHITYRDAEELFSYCPKGKEQLLTDDGQWQRAGRQSAKVSRLPRMVINEVLFAAGAVTDKDVETFALLIKGVYTERENDYKFEEVSGNKIDDWYMTDKYFYDDYSDEVRRSALHGSCMKDPCEGIMALYTKHPENISMIILTDANNKLRGRALLWTLDDGKKFMDRQYCVGEKFYKMFQQYASDKGYYRYIMDKYSLKECISPDGREVEIDLKVTLSGRRRVGKFPYLDSFRFCAIKNMDTGNNQYTPLQLSSYLASENINAYLRDTSGGCSRIMVKQCAVTGVVGSIGEIESRIPYLYEIKCGTRKGQFVVNKHAHSVKIKIGESWYTSVACAEDTWYDTQTGDYYLLEDKRTNKYGEDYCVRHEVKTGCGYVTHQHDGRIVNIGSRRYELRIKCDYLGYDGWKLKDKIADFRAKKNGTYVERKNIKALEEAARAGASFNVHDYVGTVHTCEVRPSNVHPDNWQNELGDELPPLPF